VAAIEVAAFSATGGSLSGETGGVTVGRVGPPWRAAVEMLDAGPAVTRMIPHTHAEPPEPPPVLVHAFFDASSEAIEFLAHEPGFRSAVAVEQLSDRDVVSVAPEAVTGVFFARRAFSTERLAGEVTYGDRELVVNLTVGPVPPPLAAAGPYALWEWVAALGAQSGGEGAGAWPATATRVRRAVAALGAEFREHAPRIADAGPEVVRRLDAARTMRLAEWVAQEAEWEHRSVAARAAEAFRAADYRSVISLLEPLEDRLTPAERMKLVLARRRS
jgi:hypothetical protein